MGWEPHIRKSAFRKRSCSCRPHTIGALHHPSQKADHLRTALRESDIPILIVVHDWALLLDAFQEKVTISYKIIELHSYVILLLHNSVNYRGSGLI